MSVVQFRLENGLCHQCGTRIYEIEENLESKRRRLTPLSIVGVVCNGRCLHCYPDASCKQETPVPEHAPSMSAFFPVAVTTPSPAPRDMESQSSATMSIQPAGLSFSCPTLYENEQSAISPVSEQVQTNASASERNVQNTGKRVTRSTSRAGSTILTPRIRIVPSSPPDSPAPVTEKAPAKKKKAKTKILTKRSRKTRTTSDELPNVDGCIVVKDFHGCAFTGKLLSGTLKKGTAELSYTYGEDDDWAGRTSFYKGEIANGKLHGHGYQNDAAGCIYEGNFEHGAANGYGECRWPTGWIYKGEWLNDLRHGNGKCFQSLPEGESRGECYNGEWKEDMWHGQGELYFSGGDSYKGEFFEDKMHGIGTYTFSDGSVYHGEFKKDFRNGHGRMDYADGQVYEGGWKNNWRDGFGKLTSPDGKVFEGTFRADERQDGLVKMPDGIFCVVKNGRLQSH